MTQPRGPNEHLATLAVDAAPHEQPPLPPVRQPQISAEEMAKVTAWCEANPAVADWWRPRLIAKPRLRKAILG